MRRSASLSTLVLKLVISFTAQAFAVTVGRHPAHADELKPPLETIAGLSGPDALSANLGTLGFHGGASLTYRHLGPPRFGDTDSFLGAWTPFSFMTLGLGFEYARPASDLRYLRSSLALAIRPTESLNFSIAYRGFHGMALYTDANLSTFDLGIGFRPTRWISATAAIENVNAPVSKGYSLPRTYALALGIRPFSNDIVTFGGEVRLLEDVNISAWPAPRLTLDIWPVSWLGILASATIKGEAFFGLSLRERHLDGGFGLGLSQGNTVRGSYVFARLSSQAKSGLNISGRKSVQIALRDGLKPGDGFALLRLGTPAFGEIPLALRAYAERSDIRGVRLVSQGINVGFATLRDVRDAMLYLRKKGKIVVFELGDADDKDIYLASAADHINAEAQSTINFNGVKVTLQSFKNALDKIGVRVEATPSGRYKNAPDAFTRVAPSAEQIEVQTAILDRYYQTLVDAVSEGRGLGKDKVQSLIEKGLFSATSAREQGLIDGLSWEDNAPKTSLRYSLGPVVDPSQTKVDDRQWSSPKAIALIPINGTITSGPSLEDPFGFFELAGAATIVEALNEARDNPKVKAIVLRIDSPGGDILASDIIWQEVLHAKQVKPVIVSMGDLAASGGYYIAAAADCIFAQPETLTGSIGVFTTKLDLSGLFEKIGISNFTIKRGPRADLFDFTHPLSPEDQKLMQEYVQELYRDFVTKVAASRHLSFDAVDKIAQGRVWTGDAALRNGLVDKLGGLHEAIAEAKRRAGLREAEVIQIRQYPAMGAPLGQFAAGVRAAFGLGAAASNGIDVTSIIGYVKRLGETFNGHAMYYFPYTVRVD